MDPLACFIPDNPEEGDLLGHDDVFIPRLVDQIRSCPRPFVLGIHGDWGTGKTSVLKKIGRLLVDSQDCEVILFEPWKHETETRPEVALLHAIREHFSKKKKVWDETRKIAHVATYGAMSMFLDLAGVLSGESGKMVDRLRAEGERVEATRGETVLESEQFRTLFGAAIKHLASRKRVVILVDDLDRCADAAVVRLLEATKIYFHVDPCVFVIAADNEAIVRAMHRHLYPDDTADHLARTYAEKLFQAVVHIPRALDLQPLIHRWCDDLPGVADRLCDLQERFCVLPPNPRKVKRFLGELRVRLDQFRRFHRAVEPHWPLLVLVQSLQTFHPRLYRKLESQPDYLQVLFDAVGDVRKAVDEDVDALRIPPNPIEGARGAFPPTWDPGDARILRPALLLQALAAGGGMFDHQRDDLLRCLLRKVEQAP